MDDPVYHPVGIQEKSVDSLKLIPNPASSWDGSWGIPPTPRDNFTHSHQVKPGSIHIPQPLLPTSTRQNKGLVDMRTSEVRP